MTRLTVLVDLAGRAMIATEGSPKTVAGAVALDSLAMPSARSEMRGLPKWGKCSLEHAEHVIDFLSSQAVSVGIVSTNRDTPLWRKFDEDAQVLQAAIVRQSKKVAGWAKTSNLLKFLLLGSGCAVATGHALRVHRGPRIHGPRGTQLVECSTICDREIDGPENIEVFTSFWSEQHIPKSRLARMGFEVIKQEVSLASEQEEPALLLADYVAGLGLGYCLEERGWLPLPLEQAQCGRLLGVLKEKGKLVILEEDFAHTQDEIFGEVMAKAREFLDG